MRSDAAACGDKPTDFIPAVADWLDSTRSFVEMYGDSDRVVRGYSLARALDAARAYLGESA